MTFTEWVGWIGLGAFFVAGGVLIVGAIWMTRYRRWLRKVHAEGVAR
jgi:hypothetical protein